MTLKGKEYEKNRGRKSGQAMAAPADYGPARIGAVVFHFGM